MEKREKSKRFEHIFFRDWCKGCGICVEFCPKRVLKMDGRGKPVSQFPERCTGCRLCELRCPDFAIAVVESE